MGFWTLLLITFLGAFFGNLFFNPPFQAFMKKLWRRTFCIRHPHISRRKRKEIEAIRSIALLLALIGPLPYNPGELTTRIIRDFLFDMRNKAEKLKSKELRGIKNKLILYSGNENKIVENMDLIEVQNILGRNNTRKLSEDIWRAISNIEQGKKEKR